MGGGCVSAAVGQAGHSGRVKPGSGSSLFKDFQILGRVWTHPWCLQLNYISKENKVSGLMSSFIVNLTLTYLLPCIVSYFSQQMFITW